MGKKSGKAPAQPTTTTDMGLFGSTKTGKFGSTFNPTDFQKEYTGLTEQGILNAQKALNNREIAQEAVDNLNNAFQTDFRNQLLTPALNKGWLRGSSANDVMNVANQDYQNRRYDLVNNELSRQQQLLSNALSGYGTMYDMAKGTTGISNALNQANGQYALKAAELNNQNNSMVGQLLGSVAGIAGTAVGGPIGGAIGNAVGGAIKNKWGG